MIRAVALLIALPGAYLRAAEPLPLREERALQAAVARVAPSVVRIETVGGLERVEKLMVGTGPTTGLVVSPDGYIISSAFNFAQKPDSILVTLPGGKRQAAKLVATDHARLLVLLKVDVDDPLTPAEAVPTSEIRVGQWAVAVGRTFEADVPNASVGIVSAVGRIWGKAIQTDAKISPNNYGGPLVDITGRVLGVLVPMSPQGSGDVAGVEWYDSGIGFAVPLADVEKMLGDLKNGKDLHPGLLGVSLKGGDLYSGDVLLAAAAATGPAFKAGLRKGDKIVEIGQTPIARQAQLKHALGPMYAGQSVRIVALRGDERIEREIVLAEKIDPYAAPFLGVLPMRPVGAATEDGVTIRYVYPDSPAAQAGLKPGDRIQTMNSQKVGTLAAALEQLQTLGPGDELAIEARRGDETLLVKTALTTLPESLPGELPPAYDASKLPADGAEKPAAGLVPFKLPEFENECLAYVPENYRGDVPLGLIVWLHAPGGFDTDELVSRWKPLCEQHGFVLLAPKAADPSSWQPTELQFVRRAMDEALKRYAIDANRVAVHGHQAGATLAYLFALTNPDLVRAVAAVDAPLPRVARMPEPDPTQRLAFYTTLATKAEQSAAVEAGIKRLREAKYPVVVQDVGEQNRYLTAEELAALVQWIDSLDRL